MTNQWTLFLLDLYLAWVSSFFTISEPLLASRTPRGVTSIEEAPDGSHTVIHCHFGP